MSSIKNIDNCRECKKASLCFQQLYPDELDFISSKKKQLTYLQGETLFKQGAFSPYVIFIVEGLVKIFLQTGPDKQINIQLAQSGIFLAFSSIFDESIYNYSAIALKDSTICMIDKQALKQLMQKNTNFTMLITLRNCRNESHFIEIIKNISYKQMRGKLAAALLYLNADEFKDQDIFQYLTRQDIADFASISTESAIKFLKEFEKEKILKLNGRDIKIIDINRLYEFEKKG